MKAHLVHKLVQTRFHSMSQIRVIRWTRLLEAMTTIVCRRTHSRVDYCNNLISSVHYRNLTALRQSAFRTILITKCSKEFDTSSNLLHSKPCAVRLLRTYPICGSRWQSSNRVLNSVPLPTAGSSYLVHAPSSERRLLLCWFDCVEQPTESYESIW